VERFKEFHAALRIGGWIVTNVFGLGLGVFGVGLALGEDTPTWLGLRWMIVAAALGFGFYCMRWALVLLQVHLEDKEEE
jgi:hypothetical protein